MTESTHGQDYLNVQFARAQRLGLAVIAARADTIEARLALNLPDAKIVAIAFDPNGSVRAATTLSIETSRPDWARLQTQAETWANSLPPETKV